MINKVIKRDGRVVDFDSSKILAAVEKSMKAAGQAAPQGAAAVTEAVIWRSIIPIPHLKSKRFRMLLSMS